MRCLARYAHVAYCRVSGGTRQNGTSLQQASGGMARVGKLLSLCAVGLWQLTPPPLVRAQGAADSSAVAIALRDIVAARRHAPQRWSNLIDVVDDLTFAYDANGWAPIWSRDGTPSASARLVIEQLALLKARGLEPADYDVTALQQVAALNAAPLTTPQQRADFDITLSSGALRVLMSLRHGRISPSVAHTKLLFSTEPYDAVAQLRAMAVSTNPSLRFDEAEPPYLHYHMLKNALAQYRAMRRDTSLHLPILPRTVRPDSNDAGVPALRRLLVAFGDLSSLAPTPDDSLRYDSVLVNSVRAFQGRHGLEIDGVIGPATRERLRIPFDARIQKIITTLERWRWLPHAFSGPTIVVNVPAFQLHAFSGSATREENVLSMSVVVGDAFDHKTPLFSGAVQYLDFSPYWNVPYSIARNEILPKARRDADYLARNHFEILNSAERVIANTPSAFSAVAGGRARVRQRPGADNALGRVKFIFPNDFNVYMHDTPVQSAFDRTRRDLSHGCIRLSDPARLAEWLLRDQPEWTDARIGEAMTQTEPLRVDLTNPVPVHILYGTVVVGDDGTVHFYDDIYGHDRTLASLLAGGYPYPR